MKEEIDSKQTNKDIKKLSISIVIIIISIIVLGIIGRNLLYNNYAKVTLQLGEIQNTYVLGEYESTYKTLMSIQHYFSIAAIVSAIIIIIYTFIGVILSKESISIKLLQATRNIFLIGLIAVTLFVLYYIIEIILGVHLTYCMCGYDYMNVVINK